MSSKWPPVSLGEVVRPVSRPERVDPHRAYPILGAHWYAKGLYVKDVKPGSAIQAKTLYRVAVDDFVYNRLFAWMGSFAVATREEDGKFVSNEFLCYRAEPQKLDPRFLWLYFSQKATWSEVLGLSTGSTPTSRNRLKEEQLLAMQVPLPPLDEQRRIVARIEALATKIEEARELRGEAEARTRELVISLHLSAAGGRAVRLGDLLALDEQRVPVSAGETYPLVGLKSFGGGLFSRAPLSAGETTYRYLHRLDAGAVVLSQVKGWEGAVAVCGSEFAGAYASPEYRTFTPVGGLAVPDYLRAIVPTPWFWQQLAAATRGVGGRRERTRPEQFLELRMPFPNARVQRGLLGVLGRVHDLQTVQNSTSNEMAALVRAAIGAAFAADSAAWRNAAPIHWTADHHFR